MTYEDVAKWLIERCEDFTHGLAILGAAHCIHDEADWRAYEGSRPGSRDGWRDARPRRPEPSPLRDRATR